MAKLGKIGVNRSNPALIPPVLGADMQSNPCLDRAGALYTVIQGASLSQSFLEGKR